MRFTFLFLTGMCVSAQLIAVTDATWNINAAGNWNSGASWTTNPTFPNGIDDIARFGNVITVNRIVTLGQNITVGTVEFNNTAARAYTISGANSLIFSVTSGSAAINILGTNTGSHVISVSGSPTAIGLSSPLVITKNVGGTATFMINAPISRGSNSLTVSNAGTGAITLSGLITGDSDLIVSSSNTGNTVISGAIGTLGTHVVGALTRSGTSTGSLTLSAANFYTGTTSVNSGLLTYNINGAILAGNTLAVGDGVSTAATFTVATAGAMTSANALSATINSNGTMTQAAGGDIFLNSLLGSGAITLGSGTSLFDLSLSADKTFSGAIGGGTANASMSPEVGARLTKEGTATLTLSGASSYASRTFIANGVLVAQTAGALGSIAANTGVFVRSTGGTGSLYLDGASFTVTKAFFLNGAGSSSTGALRNFSGANTISGNVTIGWSGGSETSASNATIQVDGSSLTINGNMLGANNLTKTGAGTLIYSGAGASTLSGLTTVSTGTLQLSKTGIAIAAGGATISSGATLSLTGAGTNQISDVATITMNGGSFTLSGAVETIGSLVFTSGTLTLGGSTLSLGGSGGPTTLLNITGQTISTPGSLTLATAGAITYAASPTRSVIATNLALGTALAHTFNIPAAGDSNVGMELSGIISGSGTIDKTTGSGTGTLLIDGASSNTNTGQITLTEGAIQLFKTAGAAASNSNISLGTGGTLALLGGAGTSQTIGSLTYTGGTLNLGGLPLNLKSAVGGTLTIGSGLTIPDNGASVDSIVLTANGSGVTYNAGATRAIIAGNLNLSTGGTHVFDIGVSADAAALEISGALIGAGSIQKNTSTGLLLLSGARSNNAYTGTVTVNAGTLQLSKTGGAVDTAATGGITLNTGGTVTLVGADQTMGTFAYTGGTFTQNGNTLILSSSATALAMSGGTTISGNVTLSGVAGKLSTSGASTTNISGTTLDLGSSAGAHTITTPSGTTMNISAQIIGGDGVATDNTITTVSAGNLILSGVTPNTYSGKTNVGLGTLTLQKTDGVIAIPGDLFNTDNQSKIDLGANMQIVDTSTVTLGGGTFNMGVHTETISTLIYNGGNPTQSTPSGLLQSAGASALTLNGTSLTGNAGLALRMNSFFDSTHMLVQTPHVTGRINITNGATLQTTPGIFTMFFTSTSILDLSATSTFSTFDIGLGTVSPPSEIPDLSMMGVIQSSSLPSAGFTKIGAGVLEFAGTAINTYTGLTTVSAGTLSLIRTGAGVSIPGDALINGTGLLIDSGNQIADTSTVTLSGGTFNLQAADTFGTFIYNSGTFTQGAPLTLLQPSTNNSGVALSMQNATITGNVFITGQAGSVRFDGAAGPATISGNIDLGGFTIPFNTGLGTDPTADMFVSGVISTGAVTKTGAGRLEFNGSASNTYTGLTTITAGELRLDSPGFISLQGDALINGGTLDVFVADQIADTSTVTLSSGTFNLANADTIGTFIFNGGTFTQGATLTLNEPSTTNPTLALSMRDTTINGNIAITGQAGDIAFDNTNNGVATINGNIDLGTFTIPFNIDQGTAPTDMQITGVISNGAVTKTGLGLLEFAGTASNTYTGLTTVTAGALKLNSPGLTSIAGDALINGGTLDVFIANQIADTSTVTLSSGTFNLANADTIGTFIFNGGTFTQGATLTLQEPSTTNPTLALSMRNTTINGNIVIAGQVGDIAFDNTNNGTATINGNIDLGTFTIPFNITEGTAATDMLISGIISNGGLTKIGLGTLVLSGANSYGGGTLVSAGTLQGDSASLQGNITDNATLVFDQSFDGTYPDMMSGIGTLIKQGSGALTLSNSNTVGVVTLSDGTLVVNGTLAGGGVMTTAPGTTLQGNGTITKDALISGNLSPGNSIDTIFFVGSQTMVTGSTLINELTPTTTDLVDVTGTFTIEPGVTLSVIAAPGTYPVPFIYNVVHTHNPGGVFGRFETVTSNLPLFMGTDTYTLTDVFLEITRVPISAVVNTGNAGSVATALDEIQASGSTAVDEIVNSLSPLDAAQLYGALDQMHPALYKGMAIAQENNAVMVRGALGERFQSVLDNEHCYSSQGDDRDQSYCEQKYKERKVHFWVSGLGDFLQQEQTFSSDSPQVGYNANTGGLVSGIDYNFLNFLYVGVLGGYTHTQVKWIENHGKGDLDSGYAGLYFSAIRELLYVNLSVTGAWSNYREQRNIIYPGVNQTAKNHHHGKQLISHVDTGLNFEYKNFTIRPFDSLDYIIQNEGSFTETGAGVYNLAVRKSHADMLRNELGVNFASCRCLHSGKATLDTKFSWVREVRMSGKSFRSNFVGTDTPFTVYGYFPNRNLFSFGASLTVVALQDLLTCSVYYNGVFGSKYIDNGVGGQINFGF